MIKKVIPIYILPKERTCDMCTFINVNIKENPCVKCNTSPVSNSKPYWEISPERKIKIEINNQRIEHLEFMVLKIQQQMRELFCDLKQTK